MISRLKRFFDLRPGEGLPVLVTCLYIAIVVASYMLAKPIRNGLFLKQYGAYNLAYVYVGVPLVLAVFVPVYTRIVARRGHRAVITATLVFFALNGLAFWYAFTVSPVPALAAAFYIWVNCYGVIAPVQAWTFAISLFDTRQARRLFGLIGGGAALGAIMGGVLAKTLIGPVGGAVNLMLVMAGLMLLAAVIVNVTRLVIPLRRASRIGGRSRVPFRQTLALVARTKYLRLLAAQVVLIAIVTQWSGFQFSLVADRRFGGDENQLTEFFGVFNSSMGVVALLVQLLLTGPALRRFGIALTILLLPASLGLGSFAILLLPGLWSVLFTNGLDQSLRFSIDKASYELLYVPISPATRSNVKATIDLIVNRGADAVGGVLLGLATGGFLMTGGAGLDLRGTAAVNLALVAAWIGVALALRRGYVESIEESIHQHRLDTERAAAAVMERSTADVIAAKLTADDPQEILYALSLFEDERERPTHPALRFLLDHPAPDVRRKALAVLRAAGDRSVSAQAERLLQDADLETRTEALLYLTAHGGIDPVARIQALGDFQDFSIRAGMVAFLAQPGPTQNLDAARAILDAMVGEAGSEGRRARLEAARLLAALPDGFDEPLARLVRDPDREVARQALRASGRRRQATCVDAVIDRLGDAELAEEAAHTLAKLGEPIVDALRAHLFDPGTPIDARREIPQVLVRIGSPAAQRALMEGLLESDTMLRLRIIASLNKLQRVHPEFPIDAQVVESVLAAELIGHYRSYQILNTLGADQAGEDPMVQALRQSMDQELERIFRLMGLLLPGQDVHSAYFGLRSDNPAVRANAVEFLDNVLKPPQLRNLVVPLLDSQVTLADRVGLAERLVGSSVETREDAVATLLASDDPWLRSCAAYAVGTLGLKSLEPALDRWVDDPDPLLRETVRSAKERLARAAEEPAVAPEQAAAAEGWETEEMGVG